MENLYEEIPYLRIFGVKYIGPTNNRGARVKIIDLHRSHNEKTISKTISFDYSKNNIWEMALEYLNKIGIKVLYRCGDKDRDYLLTDNFKTDLK
jgi:hypothetical protein